MNTQDIVSLMIRDHHIWCVIELNPRTAHKYLYLNGHVDHRLGYMVRDAMFWDVQRAITKMERRGYLPLDPSDAPPTLLTKFDEILTFVILQGY